MLSFLIVTMARQADEQRQWRLHGGGEHDEESRGGGKKKKADGTPETGLDPPRFVRRALECCLNDWNAVRTMLLAGTEDKDKRYIIRYIYIMN